MSSDNIRALLVNELREIYAAEQRILQALPAFAEAAVAASLRTSFQSNLIKTNDQIVRLDRMFEVLGEAAEGRVSMAVEGIVSEAQKVLQQALEPPILDLALIAAAQKIAHYEIAAYGTLSAYSRLCGIGEIHDELESSLEEEKETDRDLTRIALADISIAAPDCEAG